MNVFCTARAVNPSFIMVAIGFGFFVELTLDEAVKFIREEKLAALEKLVLKSFLHS